MNVMGGGLIDQAIMAEAASPTARGLDRMLPADVGARDVRVDVTPAEGTAPDLGVTPVNPVEGWSSAAVAVVHGLLKKKKKYMASFFIFFYCSVMQTQRTILHPVTLPYPCHPPFCPPAQRWTRFPM